MPGKLARVVTCRPHPRLNWEFEKHQQHESGDFDWTYRDVIRVIDTHDGFLRIDRVENGKPVSEICFKTSCERISGITVQDA